MASDDAGGALFMGIFSVFALFAGLKVAEVGLGAVIDAREAERKAAEKRLAEMAAREAERKAQEAKQKAVDAILNPVPEDFEARTAELLRKLKEAR